MKFMCTCGEVVFDQTDRVPHKAWLLRDQDDERFGYSVGAEVAAFIGAVREGTGAAWLTANPQHGSSSSADADVVESIVLYSQRRYASVAYECTACGRVYVDRAPDGAAGFVRYAPESGDHGRVFSSPLGPPTNAEFKRNGA
jgi:hypothetical protein